MSEPHTHDENCNHLEEEEVLNEIYYPDIMKQIDPNYLPHRDYSHLIKSVNYRGHKGNTLKFFVPNHYNGWETYVRFVEWDEQVNDPSITAVEAARLLFWGANLKVHCGCPAFLFWGSNYILSQLDAAIVPEARFPHVRNPRLKGIVCKHLNRTLKVLPFHLGNMAAAIKQDRNELKKTGGQVQT